MLRATLLGDRLLTVLVLVWILCYTTSTTNTLVTRQKFFTRKSDTKTVRTLLHQTQTTEQLCAFECLNHSGCNSANFNELTGECEVLKSHIWMKDQSMFPYDGWTTLSQLLDGKCQSDMLPGTYLMDIRPVELEINATDIGMIAQYKSTETIDFDIVFSKNCFGKMVLNDGTPVNFEYDPETCELFWGGRAAGKGLSATFNKKNCIV